MLPRLQSRQAGGGTSFKRDGVFNHRSSFMVSAIIRNTFEIGYTPNGIVTISLTKRSPSSKPQLIQWSGPHYNLSLSSLRSLRSNPNFGDKILVVANEAWKTAVYRL